MECAQTFALTILLLGFPFQNSGATSWNYTDQAAWESVAHWYCGGTRQSPININTNNVYTNNSLMELNLTNFDRSFSGDFINSGHTARFSPDFDMDSTALLENHFGTYKLEQLHFHWGATSMEGSEHRLDGETYSGEIHFVARKTTGSFFDDDYYTVLAVLLDSTDSSLDDSLTWLELYNNIPNNFGNINLVSGLDVTEFFPSSMSYYHYEGSFTTPPCYETVQWFVLKNTVSVPSDFLDALRASVDDEHGNILTKNYRGSQDQNGRSIMIKQMSSAVTNVLFRPNAGLLMFIAVLTATISMHTYM